MQRVKSRIRKIHLKIINTNWKQYMPIIVFGARDNMINIGSCLQGAANLEVRNNDCHMYSLSNIYWAFTIYWVPDCPRHWRYMWVNMVSERVQWGMRYVKKLQLRAINKIVMYYLACNIQNSSRNLGSSSWRGFNFFYCFWTF